MFKPVNHDSRIPSVLQAHTKENIIAQLAAVGVFLAYMWIKDAYKEKKLREEIALNKANPPLL
mgnify:CR=1 FL=1